MDRTAATVGDALVLEVRTLKTTWALSALPSWDRPWPDTETTWSSFAILFSRLVIALWSLLVSLAWPSTTRVPVVSLTGWNGAARVSACSLGVLAGRNELLSVFTAVDSAGSSAMHKSPAITQPAMMAQRNRIAKRASPAMRFPIDPPGSMTLRELLITLSFPLTA